MSKITFGEVRFSYMRVFEPAPENSMDAGKYSVSILIDKKDKKSLDCIQKAIGECLKEHANVLGTKGAWRSPLRDGDKERDDENYKGHYFITARSQNKPGIVDRNRQPILDKSEFKSGDYGYVNVSFFAYNNAGNKGIGCSLNHIMKSRDGEALDGSISAEKAFEGVVFEDEYSNIPNPFANDDIL